MGTRDPRLHSKIKPRKINTTEGPRPHTSVINPHTHRPTLLFPVSISCSSSPALCPTCTSTVHNVSGLLPFCPVVFPITVATFFQQTHVTPQKPRSVTLDSQLEKEQGRDLLLFRETGAVTSRGGRRPPTEAPPATGTPTVLVYHHKNKKNSDPVSSNPLRLSTAPIFHSSVPTSTLTKIDFSSSEGRLDTTSLHPVPG